MTYRRLKPPSFVRRREFIRRAGALAGSAAVTLLPVASQGASDKLPPKPPARARGVPRTSTRVQLGEGAKDGPSWIYANGPLQIAWRQAGGDWIAGLGSAFSVSDATKPVVFEVTAIVRSLLLANTGFHVRTVAGGTPKFWTRVSASPPALSVVTYQGTFQCPCVVNCFIDPSANQTINGDDGGANQTVGFFRFDLSSVSGAVQSASLTLTLRRYGAGATLACECLDMPIIISDPATQLGGVRQGLAAKVVSNDRELARNPAIVFYSECSSEAAIKASWSVAGPGSPAHVCLNPQFVQWPEVGLTALRMESQSPTNHYDNSSILTWRKYAGGKMNPSLPGTYQELYTRYLLRIDPDVYLGMTEAGVKLPGFEAADNVQPPSDWSYRMEHGSQSAANPYLFRLWIYSYDYVNPLNSPTRGKSRMTSACLKAGQLYSIEQHVKLNTLAADGNPNPDGVIEIFVDGVLVYSDYAATITQHPSAGITNIPFANFFHGGTGLPMAAMHYEFSGIATSQQYIGPPRRKAVATTSAWPSWRQQMAPGEIATLAGSSMSLLGTNNVMAIDAWDGLAAGVSEWYSAANGGHTDSSDNGVYAIDFAADAPAWTVLRPCSLVTDIPPDAQTGYYRDGRPASRHTYNSPQFIAARNRVMLFYSVALWRSGGANGLVDGFRLDDYDWDAAGTWQTGPIRELVAAVCAKNPVTEDVYVGKAGNWAKWTQATAQWTSFTVTPGTQWQFSGTLIDAKRNRWVNLSQSLSLGLIDLRSLTFGQIALTGVAETTAGDYGAIVHDTNSDAYVACCSDGRVYRINPDSGESTKIAQLPAAKNGVQNRFAYFESLGGIAYYPEFHSNILFLATQ